MENNRRKVLIIGGGRSHSKKIRELALITAMETNTFICTTKIETKINDETKEIEHYAKTQFNFDVKKPIIPQNTHPFAKFFKKKKSNNQW